MIFYYKEIRFYSVAIKKCNERREKKTNKKARCSEKGLKKRINNFENLFNEVKSHYDGCTF